MPELWPAAVRTIVSYTGFGAFCSVNAVMPTPPPSMPTYTHSWERSPGKFRYLTVSTPRAWRCHLISPCVSGSSSMSHVGSLPSAPALNCPCH